MNRISTFKGVALGLMLLECACARAGPGARAKGPDRDLTSLKAEVMSADYRADLVTLARLRKEALSLAGAPALGDLAEYWAGYAAWRLALNGANHGMSSSELAANLEEALARFEASFAQRAEFADAWAAAASVTGWLATLRRGDAPAMQELIGRSRAFLSRARELEPDNPRVLWVLGAVYLFSPPDRGGSKERAVEIYRRMAEAAEAAGPSRSPLPDWGRAEALMSLAYAHLQQSPPDLKAAGEEARAALRLQPDWSYVRDVLVPQIEAARASRARRPVAAPSGVGLNSGPGGWPCALGSSPPCSLPPGPD